MSDDVRHRVTWREGSHPLTIVYTSEYYSDYWELWGPRVSGLEIMSDGPGGLTPTMNGLEMDPSILTDLGFYVIPGEKNKDGSHPTKYHLFVSGSKCLFGGR